MFRCSLNAYVHVLYTYVSYGIACRSCVRDMYVRVHEHALHISAGARACKDVRETILKLRDVNSELSTTHASASQLGTRNYYP